VLEALAVRQHHGAHGLAKAGKHGFDARRVQRAHGLVGDNDGMLAAHMRGQQVGAVQQAAANVDRVTTRPEIDFKRDHEWVSCAGGPSSSADSGTISAGGNTKPAISSCIRTILASCATVGLPVSIMKSATSR